MHSTLRVMNGKTTARQLKDYQNGGIQRYQKPLIIYGIPGLDINNTMEARNHATCAIAKQKIGIMS
jgi:hypothetical protein